MIGFIDRFIERKMKTALHKKREKMLSNTIDKFIKNNPDVSKEDLKSAIKKLKRDLIMEADRIYAVADRSILAAFIKRAKYAFWFMAIISTVVVVGSLGAFTGGTAVPFIMPIVSALSGWAIIILTIPVSYNERIQGSMDSVLLSHQKLLKKSETSEVISPTFSSSLVHSKLFELQIERETKKEKNSPTSVVYNKNLVVFHPFKSLSESPCSTRASESTPNVAEENSHVVRWHY